MWMWCSAFGNGRTDVDDKEGPGRNVPCAVALITEDRLSKLTDIADNWTFRSNVRTVVYMTNWITENSLRVGCKRTSNTVVWDSHEFDVLRL
jgi:hypothetical protein